MNKKDRQQLLPIVRALRVLSMRLAASAPGTQMGGSTSKEQMTVSEFAKYLSNELAKFTEE